MRWPVAQEHDLAYHASLTEQLLRAPGLGKWNSPRDQRLDLSLLKEVKQGDQILSKQIRFQPFECLDAVGNDAFPAGKKPAACDVQPEDSGPTKALTTTWPTGRQSLPASMRSRPSRGAQNRLSYEVPKTP